MRRAASFSTLTRTKRMHTPTIIELQNAIDRLLATAEAAAQKRAESERRRLNLPSPNTTRWRRTDQAWLARYLTVARSEERARRQPQIDWLTRKVERLDAIALPSRAATTIE